MEQIFRGKVAEAGRVVIPAAIRERLGLAVGTDVVFSVDENGMRLVTLDQAIDRAQDYFASLDQSGSRASDDLIRERRRESKQDE